MRKCGILMPVFSLPSKYGIGTFSKEAYDFVDFLCASQQKYWQILPLGPTGYGDSPYQSFSTFAGNPYFIDVDEFVKEGFISEKDCKKYSVNSPSYVDYEALYDKRYKLLRLAYKNSNIEADRGFKRFCRDNSSWLSDYSLFMALKDYFNGKAFSEWDEDIKKREKKALSYYSKLLLEETRFYSFLQYFFKKQWLQLKAYANKKGVEIIGDIPIYVAADSSDVWASPELFDLDEEIRPKMVAGCPPDPFAATGQLWGNPLYRWDYHKKTGYEWWLRRIAHCFELYDVVRIDHFRGFDEYYAIPYGDPTAEFGKWKKGPGYSLFKTFKEKYGDRPIIAEDLGFLTDSVRALVKRTNYPGMKVLQFAFSSDNTCEYLPHMLDSNRVIYTGTHDNETTRGWYERIRTEEKKTAKYLEDYLGVNAPEKMALALIRQAYASVCDTAIIPMQDFLNIGAEGRINKPSTLGGNWQWRMAKGAASAKLAKEIVALTRIFNR